MIYRRAAMGKARYLFPSILYYGLIFFLSAQPNLRIGIDFPFLDKILHTLLYLGLGLCLAYSLARLNPRGERRRIVVLIVLGILLGTLDEFHQAFVPGRSVDVLDAAVDVLGVLLGGLAFQKIRRAGRLFSPPGSPDIKPDSEFPGDDPALSAEETKTAAHPRNLGGP